MADEWAGSLTDPHIAPDQISFPPVIRKNPADVQWYIYGPDLTSVLDTDLCMPILILQALENALRTMKESAKAFGEFCPSTPVMALAVDQ